MTDSSDMGPFQTISACQESVHDFWENFTKLKTMTGRIPQPPKPPWDARGRQFSCQWFDVLQDTWQTHGTDVKNVILVNHFSSSHLLKVVVQRTWSYANSHSLPKNQGHSKTPKVYKVMFVETPTPPFRSCENKLSHALPETTSLAGAFFKREKGISLLWSNLATRIFVNDFPEIRGISWENYFLGKIHGNSSCDLGLINKQRYLPDFVPVALSKLSTEKTFCHATSLHILQKVHVRPYLACPQKTSLQLRNLINHNSLAISKPKLWFQYLVPQNEWFPPMTIRTPKFITFWKHLWFKILALRGYKTTFYINSVRPFCKTNIQPKPPANMWSIMINGSIALNSIESKNLNEPGIITFFPTPNVVFLFGVCPWENEIFNHFLCLQLPLPSSKTNFCFPN